MAKRLTDFKVLTFDCYGTLIDWETGIWDALQPLIMLNRRSDILREDALACFARHESLMESAVPYQLYRIVLEKVHQAMAGESAWRARTGSIRNSGSRSLTGRHLPIRPMHCVI